MRFEGETVWLTQQHMVELFQTSKQNVSLHIRNIFAENELHEDSVVKESLTTAADGKNYATKFYNLDVIISVGYRVKSQRGTQFRMWTTQRLREYDRYRVLVDAQPHAVDTDFEKVVLELKKLPRPKKPKPQKP